MINLHEKIEFKIGFVGSLTLKDFYLGYLLITFYIE